MNTKSWIEHFERNQFGFVEPVTVPGGSRLPELVRKPLARSLAVFQLGESGGGTRLMRYVRQTVAEEDGFTGYERAVQYFVAEEQNHARLLVNLVKYLGGDLIEKQWSNSVFRKIRHGLGLEFNLQILLTAELMAEVYYGLLYRRSGDEVVRVYCHKILSDEMRHLAFHAEFFRSRAEDWSEEKKTWWGWQFGVCLRAIAMVLAWEHRDCFKALGVGKGEVFRMAVKSGERFMRRIDGGQKLWRARMQARAEGSTMVAS
ncbi:ferritin-like domain-containing protein [Phragmitibacter flavus]|nr:ferritin-like domain-containing protein [Phragmitibacter flavus]